MISPAQKAVESKFHDCSKCLGMRCSRGVSVQPDRCKIGAVSRENFSSQLARRGVVIQTQCEPLLDGFVRSRGKDSLGEYADQRFILQRIARRRISTDDVIVQHTLQLPTLLLCQLRQMTAPI